MMRTKNAARIEPGESAHLAPVKRGWFADRFEANPNRTRISCSVCGREMWLPACKVGKYKTCGGPCAVRKFEPAKVARSKQCEICGKEFVPRLTQLRIGQGRFCTAACRSTAVLPKLFAPEAAEKSNATRAAMRARGLIKYVRGPKHRNWKGGKEALRLRQLAKVKDFRSNNLERVRAWEHNSRVRRRNAGKLPSNAVSRLIKLQRGYCAVCKMRLGSQYHLDHIVSIAKGGRNEFHNVQLLCVDCNLRKSDKHPVVFMQSRGYLL